MCVCVCVCVSVYVHNMCVYRGVCVSVYVHYICVSGSMSIRCVRLCTFCLCGGVCVRSHVNALSQ